MDIGFIGLGNMGYPMASRVLQAGHRLVVNDIDDAAVAKLVALGAVAAKNPVAVADECETVIVSLPSPDVIRAVALGDDGLAAGRRIKVYVDLSTTGPKTSRAVSRALRERDIVAVDAPVSGGVIGAGKGTLAVMAACPRHIFDRIAAVLEIFGRVFFVGEEQGLGQTMKLLNNYLSATALAATSEAMVFGTKAGLDPDLMLQVINAGSGRNSASQDKFPKSIMTGKFDFGFTTSLMCKDLRLFAEEAEGSGVSLLVGSAVRQLWQLTHDLNGPHADFTTIIKPLEQWAGVKVRSSQEPS